MVLNARTAHCTLILLMPVRMVSLGARVSACCSVADLNPGYLVSDARNDFLASSSKNHCVCPMPSALPFADQVGLPLGSSQSRTIAPVRKLLSNELRTLFNAIVLLQLSHVSE